MKPSHPALVEDALPVHFSRFHVGDGGMPSIIQGDAGPDADTHLGEVQPNAIRSSGAVIGHPHHFADVHAAGPGMVSDERPERIVYQLGNPACFHAEPGQGVGDVVFAAPGPSLEIGSQFNSLVAGRAQTGSCTRQEKEYRTRIQRPVGSSKPWLSPLSAVSGQQSAISK
jgi:hypothetical protein